MTMRQRIEKLEARIGTAAMVGGKAPGFLKAEGPLFQDGPVWRIELASPVWPKPSSGQKQ